MFNEFKKYFRYLNHCVILLLALMFCSISATAAGQDSSPTAPAAETTPCQGLKPFNNIDELLYQFYINLDSDCLFEMPVAELEKVWEIKILSRARTLDTPYHILMNSTDFYNKPYKTAKDAFYVEINPGWDNRNIFSILITREYLKKYYSLFPDGKTPEILPSPVACPSMNALGSPWPYSKEKNADRNKPGPDAYLYSWYSSDKTREIFFTKPYGTTRITIHYPRLRK